MTNRNKLYSKYVTNHIANSCDPKNIKDLAKDFIFMNSYFGRFLPNNKNARIIDLGCGSGNFVLFLKSLGYKNVSGIDISREQVGLAHKLGARNVQKGDITTFLRGTRDRYDLIIMKDIIEHFRKNEIEEILTNAQKALKENGGLIIRTVNAEGIFGSRYRYSDFTHEISFTQSSITHVLKNAGFRDISVCETGPVIHGVRSRVRYVLWRCLKSIINACLLIETGQSSRILTQTLITVAKKIRSKHVKIN